MKREFKFRAWIISQKKMIKVFGFNEHLVFEQTWDSPSIKENIFEIEDCVLMQFTGFKDKNGVDIYEGDIISFTTEKTCYDGLPLNTNRIGKVFWMEFRSVFAVQINKFMNQDLFVYVQNDNSVEVIGNIHENPELLAVPTAVL